MKNSHDWLIFNPMPDTWIPHCSLKIETIDMIACTNICLRKNLKRETKIQILV